MNDEAKYRAALETVCRRRGRFSRDRLEHAHNTILDMVNVARVALGLPEVESIEDAENDLPAEEF